MTVPPRYRLSEAEKDALLLEQAALIKRMMNGRGGFDLLRHRVLEAA